MLFTNDLVLINETRVDQKLEIWRSILESKSSRISRTKTTSKHCKHLHKEYVGEVKKNSLQFEEIRQDYSV